MGIEKNNNNSNNLKQVLVVDNDADVHSLLSATLQTLPVTVHYASNGQQALDMITDQQPDLIILELAIPVMNGMDMLYLLNRDPQTNSIPVIIHSRLIKPAYNNFLEWPAQVVETLEKTALPTELSQVIEKVFYS